MKSRIRSPVEKAKKEMLNSRGGGVPTIPGGPGGLNQKMGKERNGRGAPSEKGKNRLVQSREGCRSTEKQRQPQGQRGGASGGRRFLKGIRVTKQSLA